MRIGLRWANSFAVRPFKTVIYTVGTKGILSCLLLHFTLTLPAQSFDVLDDQAFTGPLQKVSVNVTVNDKVPCASPVIRLINPPAAAVGKTELKGVYIEFTPTNATSTALNAAQQKKLPLLPYALLSTIIRQTLCRQTLYVTTNWA